MEVKEITIMRTRKYSVNYQSYGYSVGATVEYNPPYTIEDAHIKALNVINILEAVEKQKIKEEVKKNNE